MVAEDNVAALGLARKLGACGFDWMLSGKLVQEAWQARGMRLHHASPRPGARPRRGVLRAMAYEARRGLV